MIPRSEPKFASLDQSLFTVHRSRCKTPHSMQFTHYHNTVELYYLYSGERYYFIQDKTYHVKKGNLVFIAPYDIHATVMAKQIPYERFLINFRPEMLEGITGLFPEAELFAFLESGSHIIELAPKEQLLVEGLFERMLEVYGKTGDCQSADIVIPLTQLLLLINQKSGERVQKIGYINETQKMISEVTGYINNHFAEDISLETLAAKFFISECYLSRTFRRVSGVCLVDYLNGVRIKEAEELLCSTDLSVGKVAELVGYKSSTHFGRVFKQKVGCSPGIYRSKR